MLVENKYVEYSYFVEIEIYVKLILREVMFYGLFILEVEEVLKRDEELVRIRRFIKEGKQEKFCVD